MADIFNKCKIVIALLSIIQTITRHPNRRHSTFALECNSVFVYLNVYTD